MKLLALWFVIVGLSVYAWRDWYKALCGLIILTAFVEHPDMPRTIMEIPGLNPWNLVFLIVLVNWGYHREREGLRWDMPRLPAALLLLGLIVLVCAFLRLLDDRSAMVIKPEMTLGDVISDYLVNPIKWVVLGLLLFDGCRDRRRLVLGLGSILSYYFLISLQVVRWVVPSGALTGGALSAYTIRKLRTEVGYHRNDLSVMLAGAFWALMAARQLLRSAPYRAVIVVASIAIGSAVALTGGRGGYLAWGVVGLTLGVVRWRRYLLLVPVLAMLLVFFVPSVADRALEGIHGSGVESEEVDVEELTAGRNIIWPAVIDKIWDAPFIGYGRAAIQRTGVTEWLAANAEEQFIDHPHNAYLEMLLDSGVIGLFVTLALFATLLTMAFSLLRDGRKPEFVAVGGVGLALVLAQLVGAFTGQSFWPRESTVGMWCGVGLLLRVWLVRSGVPSDSFTRIPDEFAADTALWQTAPCPTPASLSGVHDAPWWQPKDPGWR